MAEYLEKTEFQKSRALLARRDHPGRAHGWLAGQTATRDEAGNDICGQFRGPGAHDLRRHR